MPHPARRPFCPNLTRLVDRNFGNVTLQVLVDGLQVRVEHGPAHQPFPCMGRGLRDRCARVVCVEHGLVNSSQAVHVAEIQVARHEHLNVLTLVDNQGRWN